MCVAVAVVAESASSQISIMSLVIIIIDSCFIEDIPSPPTSPFLDHQKNKCTKPSQTPIPCAEVVASIVKIKHNKDVCEE